MQAPALQSLIGGQVGMRSRDTEYLWGAEGEAWESEIHVARCPETHRCRAENSGGTPGPGPSLTSEIKGDLTKEMAFEQFPHIFPEHLLRSRSHSRSRGYSTEQDRQECL